jgi:hypothetical protein
MWAIMEILMFILEIVRPASSIEKAVEFDQKTYSLNPEMYGDHKEKLNPNLN